MTNQLSVKKFISLSFLIQNVKVIKDRLKNCLCNVKSIVVHFFVFLDQKGIRYLIMSKEPKCVYCPIYKINQI